MMFTRDDWFGAGRRLGFGLERMLGLCLMAMALGSVAGAQAVSTTTVQGTVYLANGQVGAGTLNVSWPAFTTASGLAIGAGHTMVTIPPDGFVSVNLAPNVGATPAGLYYTAVYQMNDGTTSTEYWVVPAAAQASVGQVRAQLMPAAQAVQAVSKSYVDQAIAELTGSLLTASGGTLSGNLYLNGDPTQPLQAADKHYVDSTFNLEVPIAGGSMTGPLATPAVNGVQAPVAGSSQTTLQAAVNAAGTNGAVQIPPSYTGTDGFTNTNGVYVADLRPTGAQQYERSVKEFGAVCDGATDDTNALQSALNYAWTHGVALTIPQGTCKTRTLNWHGESIGGLGKQVSALMGFPGQDVLATTPDSTNLLSYTRIHDLTIYVDQSMDVSCSAAEGRAPAGSCALSRAMESNSIFSPGGNGLNGTVGSGAGWAIGNCAIAMPAITGAGGNGLRVAEIENLEIMTTGTDPMAAEYPGAHSTHTCGLYLAQWPQWSEFRNIDIRGLNTGIALPALPGTGPTELDSDSNRWQSITIQATHAFTSEAGCNNVLDDLVATVGNSAATGEPPTGLVLNFSGAKQGWTVRNAVVMPTWRAVQPQLTVTAAGGAVTGVTVGQEHGLGFDPYGAQVPLAFNGGCTAQATANVNSDGSIGAVSVAQGGVGCSGTTTASVNVAGTWDTAAPVNVIAGQSMTFYAGNLLKGNGGYTVWNAAGSQSFGTQVGGGGGSLPGGGSYPALVGNSPLGTTYQADQFPGADFGAKVQACLVSVNATYGGTCDARNFTGSQSMGSNLTISTANATVLLPCATITTANQVIVTAGTRNVTLRGCALRGASSASGSQGGTVFLYSGTGAMVQVGDPTYAADTMGFHLDNVVINTTAATSGSTQGLAAYRTQEMDVEGLYLLGNANQTGMTLDGTGNYTGGSFLGDQFSGFRTAVNAIGHQVANSATTDWMNASTFVRLHIDCPTSGGSPIAGTIGINLQQGDGNTFTGGDVEGCATALHLGANAQSNTIVGLRNENSNSQVVADAGSSYNNWMTGGTMFTGQLTDNGTRNSFQDTFHRSFNGMNGDWYGSQKDATVTNHYRLGIGNGNERGLMNEIQTDYGYRWIDGYTDATAGEQFYQVQDLFNNVNRLSIGQYNNGQPSTNNQTVLNAAGTGAVVLNGSNNSGTGGVVIGSGGATETTVATIDKAGNAQFNGTLQVGGVSTLIGTPTVKNQMDAEIDAILWAGLTQSQKESLIYKDYNGNSQWYMVKDASNNWALNSATGGLDSFKAYQSTNSGDTYINASNASGLVRVNYETGAGTGFNVYGGGSSNLYASFTGTTSIKFPGLAAGSGHNCVQIDNSGYISNTGIPCGSGNGNGTVSIGDSGQIAYYTSSGTSIAGMNTIPVSAGGTGASTGTAALQNMGGLSLAQTALQTLAGPVQAPTATFDDNITAHTPLVDVRAFGAVCNASNGGAWSSSWHDDSTAIAAALSYVATHGGQVYFPPLPLVCYTSVPLAYLGQSMGGAGKDRSYIRGNAGTDVFSVVDIMDSGYGGFLPISTHIHDMTILSDDSLDATQTTGWAKKKRWAGQNSLWSNQRWTNTLAANITSTSTNFTVSTAPPTDYNPVNPNHKAQIGCVQIDSENICYTDGGPNLATFGGETDAITNVSSTAASAAITVNNTAAAGQYAIIHGLTNTGLNGTWPILSATSTQIVIGPSNANPMPTISSTADSGTLITGSLTRGAFGTSPASHFSGATVTAVNPFTGNPDVIAATTLNAAITSAGSQVASVVSTTGIYAGNIYQVGAGGDLEAVTVTAVGSGNFTAAFSHTHASGEAVAGGEDLPAYQIGACGLVFSQRDGTNLAGGGAHWNIENVSFETLGASASPGSNTCGIFTQRQLYRLSMNHVDIASIRDQFGFIEAWPASNQDNALITQQTSDTSSFNDLRITADSVPFLAVSGDNVTADNHSYYVDTWCISSCSTTAPALQFPQGITLLNGYTLSKALMFGPQDWVINELYVEPAYYYLAWGAPPFILSEIDASNINFVGGDPSQAGATGTTVFNGNGIQASSSGFGALHRNLPTVVVNGNGSKLNFWQTLNNDVLDNGLGNQISSQLPSSSGNRISNLSKQRIGNPGQVSYDALLQGDVGGDWYSSLADLFILPDDFVTTSNTIVMSPMVNDPTTPITGRYITVTSPGSFSLRNFNGGSAAGSTAPSCNSGATGSLCFSLGAGRFPIGKGTFYVILKAGVATTQVWSLSNSGGTNATYGSSTLSLTTSWQVLSFSYNTSAALSNGNFNLVVTGAATSASTSISFGGMFFSPNWDTLNAGVVNAATVNASSASGLQIAGSQIRSTNLADFSATSPSTAGMVPTWNGSQYVPTSPATAPVLTSWSSGGVKTSGAIPFLANQTRLYSLDLSISVSATKISYTPSTADNSANLYNIGIYSVSGYTGTLACQVGATPGTTFAPSTSAVTLSFLSTCNLTPGRWVLAITAPTATAVLNGGGTTLLGISGPGASSNNVTSGAVFNTSIGLPADSWTTTNSFPQISLHN